MKLLLAEYEEDLSKALVALLKHNNYLVDAVYDGQDALDYLQSETYDAAILEIMMPKKSGLEVLKQIREEGSSIPILLLTAKSEIDDRVLGLDLGADDYLTKPFSSKELVARIKAMMRRIGETSLVNLSFGNITLDTNTFSLLGNGKTIKLTSKEYQMMELLMFNRNKVISTEALLANVWGYDSEVETNVVWVFISYLRKKLQACDSTIEIKAQRGLGYILGEKK